MVRMTDDFEFDPRAVTIHAGEAVEWRNASRFKHSVTADPRLGSAVLPQGAKPFASEPENVSTRGLIWRGAGTLAC